MTMEEMKGQFRTVLVWLGGAIALIVTGAVLVVGIQTGAFAADRAGVGAGTKPVQLAELEVAKGPGIDAAKSQLQMTFKQLTFSDFRESEIPGLYEMVSGNRVMYFHPGKELLIFGEMYAKDGRSLTQEYMQSQVLKKVASLPLAHALVIGSGPKKVIEFTDPDCPFCKRLHAYWKAHKKEVTRYVFFSPIRQLHPDAPQRVVHILCADNKLAAMDDVYGGNVPPTELKQCEGGKLAQQEHETISSQFGVTGTPMLVMENSVIPGFQEARISELLTQPK